MSSVVTCEANWGAAIQGMLASARLEATPPPAVSAPTSAPVYTERLGDVLATVIRVDVDDRRVAYQLYCVEGIDWCLTGYFGLFCDALGELNVWRRYIDGGGSLATWKVAFPDGVQVKR